jgi:NAD(P)-dependent dehydrogenase (short-subunit alcohol dehydrogenase family)
MPGAPIYSHLWVGIFAPVCTSERDAVEQLKGQVAVVTGGSAGIGLAIARRFAAEGARVVITGRNAAALDAVAAELGPDVTAVPGDASVPADLDRLAGVLRAAGVAVDVLVANAGSGTTATVAQATEEQFDAATGVTFRGTYFTVQRLLPVLADGASVVVIASTAASSGTVSSAIYNASKAAVRSLARSLTHELRGRRIRVNAISPGATSETADFDAWAAIAGQASVERFVAATPVGRAGRPEDVANAALFLASDQSSFIAGVELVVDGGLSQV